MKMKGTNMSVLMVLLLVKHGKMQLIDLMVCADVLRNFVTQILLPINIFVFNLLFIL